MPWGCLAAAGGVLGRRPPGAITGAGAPPGGLRAQRRRGRRCRPPAALGAPGPAAVAGVAAVRAGRLKGGAAARLPSRVTSALRGWFGGFFFSSFPFLFVSQ